MIIRESMVLETIPELKKVIAISTDSFEKVPMKAFVQNTGDLPAPGTLLHYEGGKVTKQYAYNEHDYEHIIVLAIDKSENTMLVYGKKTQEHFMQIPSVWEYCKLREKLFGFGVGTEFLARKEIKNNGHYNFFIVHNITQSALKMGLYHRYQVSRRQPAININFIKMNLEKGYGA